MDNQYFSKEGLEKLKNELEERLSVLRPEIALRIKEAKEQGDLSENAEFDAAKEAQAFNEGRIEEIKNILEKAVVINHNGDKDFVQVGSTLKVQSEVGSHTYSIVGAAESDPVAGFISNESPLGKAFIGRKKGEAVRVVTPKGEVEYKIVDIG
ncbi:MAG: transcription elongation factor GreA [Candidatus Yanofskybacteria bacterium GW2011_GWF1_44_227]|uniref:Transcription elongation factor GreA n=1 Tax=Candidatus Yanofskybacteria bacterium GW2011_GWE2_40_11 TaxID=1619033 RepID=A0A0G0T124_9BACT|nr:MAG: transcription elongation factor GreA [Candidatus Yanofskybacteria bacterium GW2011_GWE1_40_10]KKR40795.1 MAG: transcription elongation factor GreA [Candidatus Yanofskybacteria bacterium GW2011_GWE2_40_11]KKT15910.1 MAG: transcription elongation factor GreA [Candidatus Yanofskybacteria bacterium GW2011_GWF2_43_596]KKT53576.1 MAG: transcription elongation factor GreA [Candidatus Yanofskybacteria bacterium GW2011_GWF1_44_227]HAU07910.1 transcription elongation factor GreA [Candidatus Yanof